MKYTGPRTIDAGPWTYRVLCNKKHWKKIKADKRNCGGETDNGQLIIAIKPGYTLGTQRDILMHELMHVCANVVGGGLEHRTEGMEAEEWAATLLSPTLLAILRDNPELVAWLVAA